MRPLMQSAANGSSEQKLPDAGSAAFRIRRKFKLLRTAFNELSTGPPLWQFGAHRKRCCEGDESQVKGALHPDYPRQRGSLDSRWCYLANCLCGLQYDI